MEMHTADTYMHVGRKLPEPLCCSSVRSSVLGSSQQVESAAASVQPHRLSTAAWGARSFILASRERLTGSPLQMAA